MVGGNNLRIILNTTIFIGKLHSIRSFSQLVPQISHCGGCNSSGGVRPNAKSPRERYKNLFMSISSEPDTLYILKTCDLSGLLGLYIRNKDG